MFTGLVEETRPLADIEKKDFGARLILAPPTFAREMEQGESIALDGCCLTLAGTSGGLCFDLLQETLDRTNLGRCKPGSMLNLERPLRADSRLGGHFVQGHVDGTARVLKAEPRGDDLFLSFEMPKAARAFFIEKGSIAVNGVSLTVAALEADSFGVWIIPHTRHVTNLGLLRPGDLVNLEYDMLAKSVVRFLELRAEGHLPGAA